MDFINRDDRIRQYLVPHLNNFLFDELSENYLKKTGLSDILTGVPVPIRKSELESITTVSIARGMAFVIGCDPGFKHRDNYVSYIMRISDKRFARALVSEGIDAADKKDYDYACIMFRAAMIIDPDDVDALYCYGRACKDAYELGEEEDFVARFKAESLEAFEEVTLRRPDFAESYYFLGYGYINLGLYVKAKLTWQEFMKLSSDEEKKEEISQRLASLDEPVEIEEGYNHILAGRFEEGITILEKYTEGKFRDWWPLWYYLGIAHFSMDMAEKAADEMKKVLQLSPSNRDAMAELVKIYRKLGNDTMAEKYEKKIAIVAENAEKDREEAGKQRGITLN